MAASQVIQLAQQSQVSTKGQRHQSRGQPTTFLVVDDHQAGPSSPLTFTENRGQINVCNLFVSRIVTD